MFPSHYLLPTLLPFGVHPGTGLLSPKSTIFSIYARIGNTSKSFKIVKYIVGVIFLIYSSEIFSDLSEIVKLRSFYSNINKFLYRRKFEFNLFITMEFNEHIVKN